MENLRGALPENFQQEEGKFDVGKLSSEMESESFRNSDVICSFVKLVEQLKDRLPQYDTVLSDDASGRLVSLVLRQVINEARRRKGQAEGVATYFLASGRHNSREINQKIEKFIAEKKPGINKALLVTEHISSGESILKLINILEKTGVDFDLATLSALHRPQAYSQQIWSRLYCGGSISGIGLNFYGEKQYSGVSKDITEMSPHPRRVVPAIPSAHSAGVAKARRDVARMAKALEELL